MERITLVNADRQAGMDEALGFSQEETHVIVGCGGIGFWLGLMIAMVGGRYFVLFDGDNIDHSNLNRLPVPQTWIGQNKAVALRKMIRTMRPDTVVTCLSMNITEETMSMLSSVSKTLNNGTPYYYRRSRAQLNVWDTTDDAKIQTKINEYVNSMGKDATFSRVRYRKIGYEGFKVGSYKDYQVWTQEGYTTGYRTTQANAVSSVLSAGLGFFANYLTEKDVSVNLKELITKGGCK